MDLGVSIEEYWQLTKAEMDDLIASGNRQFERKEKRRIDNLFLLADAISSRINYFFSSVEDRVEPIRPWDIYPVLFAEEKKIHEDAIADIELQKYKERRRQHAVEYNNRRKEAEDGSA